MNYVRFDQTKLEYKDRRVILDVIHSIDTQVWKRKGKWAELENKLYGLFDGYLYKDLFTLAKSLLEPNQYTELVQVIKKVDII